MRIVYNNLQISKHGELYEFNIFSATLSWSRLHIFIYSINKTKADVERCLMHVFKYIGGIPKELLTDNMKSYNYNNKSNICQVGEVFYDNIVANAILDRLLHHVYLFNITGNSYRTKDLVDMTQ